VLLDLKAQSAKIDKHLADKLCLTNANFKPYLSTTHISLKDIESANKIIRDKLRLIFWVKNGPTYCHALIMCVITETTNYDVLLDN